MQPRELSQEVKTIINIIDKHIDYCENEYGYKSHLDVLRLLREEILLAI